MTKKIRLRDFQEHLTARLAGAAKGEAPATLLGILSGGEHWLCALPDAGEILPTPALTAVPLTRPWFAGIVNIRGNLHAVTDFSAFRGGPPTPANPLSRLLLIGTRHGGNAALLVERLLGLKNPELFEAVPPEETDPAWVAGRMVDADGRPWKKLDVRGLLADPEFMEIGL